MPKPTFLVIGGQKCGTDALYYALEQHPDIGMSPNEEPFFLLMDGRLPAAHLPSRLWTRNRWETTLGIVQSRAMKRLVIHAASSSVCADRIVYENTTLAR